MPTRLTAAAVLDRPAAAMELGAPLSPTLESALSDVWADVVDFEQRDGEASEAPGVQSELTPEPRAGAASPSPSSAVTAGKNWERRQHEVMTMSLNEMKEDMGGRKLLAPDEAKRARRSAIEKKSRQRRQATLRRMRREVKLLEDTYAAMEEKRVTRLPDNARLEGGGAPQAQKPEHLLLHSHPEPVVLELERKYSELTLVAHALEQDQVALRQLLADHEHFKQDILRTAKGEGRDQPSDSTAVHNTGVPRSSSWAAECQPLSTMQFFSVVNDSCGNIRKFDDSGFFESTGASFMGWTDKRRHDLKTHALQYGFTKHFPLERHPERLLLRTWHTFRDPKGYARVFSDPSMALRFQVVQEPSSDLYVVRLDHTRPGSSMTFVSVHMVFYIQTPAGFTLVVRSVPAPEVREALEPHEYLYDIFVWTHFNYVYDAAGRVTATEIVTGGSIQDARELMSPHWLFEIMLGTLRWESNCIAPVFLKNV